MKRTKARPQRCPSLAPPESVGPAGVRLEVDAPPARCELMLEAGTNAPHAGACCAMVPRVGRITWLRGNILAGTVLRIFWIGHDCWVAENAAHARRMDQARRFAAGRHGSMAAADRTRKRVVEVPSTAELRVFDKATGRVVEKTAGEWLREAAAGGCLGTMEEE